MAEEREREREREREHDYTTSMVPPLYYGTSRTPIPDPTVLTQRSTDAAKDELRREMQHIRQIMETRMDAADKALILVQSYLDKLPEIRTMEIAQLQSLVEQRFQTENQQFVTVAERFKSIEVQFVERDTRTEQISQGNEKAINAALAAAKEALALMKASVGKE